MSYTPRHAAPRRRALDLQVITTGLPSAAARRGSAGLAATAVIAGGVAVAGVAASTEPGDEAASGPSDAVPTSRQSPTPSPDLALVSGAATRAGALSTPSGSPKHRRSDAPTEGVASAARTIGTPAASEPAPAKAPAGAHRRSTTETSPTAEATPSAEPSPAPSEEPSAQPSADPVGDLVDILDGLTAPLSPSTAPELP